MSTYIGYGGSTLMFTFLLYIGFLLTVSQDCVFEEAVF